MCISKVLPLTYQDDSLAVVLLLQIADINFISYILSIRYLLGQDTETVLRDSRKKIRHVVFTEDTKTFSESSQKANDMPSNMSHYHTHMVTFCKKNTLLLFIRSLRGRKTPVCFMAVAQPGQESGAGGAAGGHGLGPGHRPHQHLLLGRQVHVLYVHYVHTAAVMNN